MSFADKIKAFGTKALIQANKNTSNIVEDLFTNIVVLTPSPSNPGRYAKGHLANQWYPALNSFDLSTSDSANPNGASSLSRIKALISSQLFLGRDSVVTLTNSCDYAYRAEFIGWPAGQGKNGWKWTGRVGAYRMVGTAINKIKGKYK